MKMYIDGAAADASNGEVIEVLNPATGELIDTVPSATQEDVSRAVTAAVAGEKAWAAVPLHRRMAMMQRFIDLVMEEENHKRLALVQSREMGKPYKESYNDFGGFKAHVEGFISAARNNLTGTVIPFGVQAGMENDFDVSIREPIGTIVGIIPFNAPLTLFAKKVAPALLSGNCCIAKPASDDPLTVLLLSELMYEAGFPGYAYQCITGRGETVGEWLTADERIAGVNFTGSTAAGRRVAENCGRNLKYQSLELGGNAPMIVCADADIDAAVAEATACRAFYMAGQICSVPKRFIVHRSVHDEFLEKLLAKVKTVKLGDPMDPETTMGTLISEKAAMRVEAQVGRAIEQGARLVYGNERRGAFYGPTVLDGVDASMDIAHDVEVFGPVFPIITFDDFDEAMALANDTKYGLGSCIFTRDLSLGLKAALRFEAGSVVINGQSLYRNLLTPYGANKDSGLGREGQTQTLLAMTQTKNIVFKNILK